MSGFACVFRPSGGFEQKQNPVRKGGGPMSWGDIFHAIQFARWPDYGLDEWWLLAALYPRLARRGVLTFAPSDARSPFLPADLEIAQWANPKSQTVWG
jgi:hypothetical protein